MESINRPELVKEHNLNLVREKLFEARRATRQQLTAMTGISTVTMGSLLQQLLDSGEALETDGERPASGRPAKVYAYNSRWRYGLTVSSDYENGGYISRAALLDVYGEPVWEERSPARYMDKETTRRRFEQLLSLKGRVGAVAVGLPGVGFGEYFNEWQKRSSFSLEALRELEESTGIPFRVENDVNLAALGYAHRHAVGSGETLVYICLMKGSYGGSAIYINGALHLGKDRFAGELAPPAYDGGWPRMHTAPPEAVAGQLVSTVMPYLYILAPHRVVIASDYIRDEQLDALRSRADEALKGRRPEFSLIESFPLDYREGLKYLVLEELKWKKK